MNKRNHGFQESLENYEAGLVSKSRAGSDYAVQQVVELCAVEKTSKVADIHTQSG